MFCDLVASTPIAESLDPEDFREVIRSFQRICVEAIERYDGFTARYTGDGVIVYFGYPRAHEDDPHRAAHVGLCILGEVEHLNDTLAADFHVAVHVRIGVHCGVVVAGEMGAGASPDARAIVGEVPHIAARLESVAEPDTMVVSDAVRDLIAGYFELEPLGDRELKGISRPMGVSRVLRPTGAVARLDASGTTPLAPLVGRHEELGLLEDAWRRARDGHGVVVHVHGEAGIGKSRLVRTLMTRLRDEPRRSQVWQCSRHHRTSTLYPLLRYLDSTVGTSRNGRRPRRGTTLADLARGAAVDQGRTMSVLSDFLTSANPQRSTQEPAMPRETRAELLRVLQAVLIANPELHPMVFVIEDVHWADPTTIEFIGRVVSELKELPVLCVITFRDESRTADALPPPDVDIALGPLSVVDVRTLLCVGRPQALEPSAIDELAVIVDGVPLFVEATMQMLTSPRRESTSADDSALGSTGVTIPPTLQGLLSERLDRFPELADVIDLAAVLGHDFPQDLLQDVDGLDRDLGPALAVLVDEAILRLVDGRYEFSHALLQEAAYERVLRRRRQALHRRVAEVLSRSPRDPATWRPEIIAEHWSRGAQPVEAARWWREAGVQALVGAAFAEAAHHFRRALAAIDTARPGPEGDDERADLATHLGASLQAGQGYAAADVVKAYERARAACVRLGDAARLAAVIRGEWMFHLLRADYPSAMQLGDELLAFAVRHGGREHFSEAHLCRGMVHMSRAEFHLARDELEAAYAGYEAEAPHGSIYGTQGDTGVGALAYLAPVMWNLGHDDASRACTDRSVELADRIGRPVSRAQAGGMRCLMYLTRGELSALADHIERARSFAAERSIAYWSTFTSLIGTWLAGRTGDARAGVQRFQELLDAYLAAGSRFGLPMFANLLADLCQHAGDAVGAHRAIELGEQHIAGTGERFSECQLLITKGDILMTRPQADPAGAKLAYETAASAARHQHARPLELRAITRLATLERRRGEPCTHLDVLSSLVAWFEPGSLMPDVVKARSFLAELEFAR